MSLRTATSVRHALAVVRYTDVSHALAEKCQRCAVGSQLPTLAASSKSISPSSASQSTPGARNRSATATSARCTSGGRGDRWLPAAPSSAPRCGPTLPTRTARSRSVPGALGAVSVRHGREALGRWGAGAEEGVGILDRGFAIVDV